MVQLADVPDARGTLARNQWFAGVFAVGIANGLALPVIRSVRQLGWLDAAILSFGISAIVWIACISGAWLLSRAAGAAVSRRDIGVGAAALFLFALPFSL